MGKDVSLVETFIREFFQRLGIQLSDDKFNTLLQFVKFGIVGVSNTVVAYLSYLAGLLFIRRAGIFEGHDLLAAQAISFVISVYWSFYWNNRFVFSNRSETRNLLKTLVKTYISYSFTGLFLSSALLVFWVEVMGMSEFIAPILNLAITVPLNFVLNKFWAFSDGGEKA